MQAGANWLDSWNTSASGAVDYWLRLTDGFPVLSAVDIVVTLLINCRLMLGSGIARNVELTMTETLMPQIIF
jgi:hypothetical protein